MAGPVICRTAPARVPATRCAVAGDKLRRKAALRINCISISTASVPTFTIPWPPISTKSPPPGQPLPTPLAGHLYRAIRIDQSTLDGVDPFHVLADADPKALADMGMHTLVVVGATFPDDTSGFVLLDDHADLAAGDRGSGEELQDHTCAIAPK